MSKIIHQYWTFKNSKKESKKENFIDKSKKIKIKKQKLFIQPFNYSLQNSLHFRLGIRIE